MRKLFVFGLVLVMLLCSAGCDEPFDEDYYGDEYDYYDDTDDY
ncbi:MAG: hypothetical protein Q4C01_05870 [Clostridia bacterium]|nr:hypothetical protein [Clostridia bacterium]